MASFLDRLERKWGRGGLPNLTGFLVVGQIGFYVAIVTQAASVDRMALIAGRVLDGEIWRLLTFLFIPPRTNPLFLFFAWYLFFLMGTTLERQWGTFKYNVFLLVGYGATVGVSFLVREMPFVYTYLAGSVFLAFAQLFPDFELYLFLLLPVKIKWLALLTWIMYGFSFLFGGWSIRLVVAASVSNFLLFFGRDIALRIRHGRRKMAAQAQRVVEENEPFHECAACGATDKSRPDLDFRYCSTCTPSLCYCEEHIRAHDHVREREGGEMQNAEGGSGNGGE